MSIAQFSKIASALLAAAFLIGCQGLTSPTASLVSNSPTILIVVPQTNGVGTNREVAVVFSKPMDPASINSGTFMVAGVTGTVNFEHIKRHYYESHRSVNPTGIVPLGPVQDFSAPHDRKRFV